MELLAREAKRSWLELELLEDFMSQKRNQQ
jgi:hypothetical protein